MFSTLLSFTSMSDLEGRTVDGTVHVAAVVAALCL